jgi:hypothetical protein
MLRIHFYGVAFPLALFLASCSCGDDEAGPSECPSELPDEGTSCRGDTSCTYEPFEGCHGDNVVGCPAECGGDIVYSTSCYTFEFKCENGSWKMVSTYRDSSTSTGTPSCRCSDAGEGGTPYTDGTGGSGGIDAGPDGSRRDSSTDDDSGSDDDAGN